MKVLLMLCAVFSILCETWATNGSYQFTYDMAKRCKEHICRRGYHYDTFYRINEALQHTTLKKDKAHVTYFEMHIAIQAASNGHVLLSPVAQPGPFDPVYEIVVGGGGNKFTELRLNLKRNAKSSAKTPNILSSLDPTPFYIKISDDGLIEFSKEGDTIPLLSYYDPIGLPIKYFSFASWTGVEAKFLYDCPAPGDSDAVTESADSQAVEPKLSNSDELKRNLLLSKLPSIPPNRTMHVKLGVKITHVKYDAMETKLTTRMAVLMSWVDDSMAWYPDKFNGTRILKFRQGQIWRPTFFVYNSDSTEALETSNPDLILVRHTGLATFHFQTEVTTWCHDSASKMDKWPHDEYTCDLIIEPWQVHEDIKIHEFGLTDSKIVTAFADIDELIQSEWDVSEITVISYEYVHVNENKERTTKDKYVVSLDLTRRATTYNIVCYTPLLVLLTFILMSFWSEPLQMFRVWFYTTCTIIISAVLNSFNYVIPTHTVPTIQIFYITVLYGVLLALLVQIFLMTSYAERLCKTIYVQNVLTFSLLRQVFCLPSLNVSANGAYARQEDCDEDECEPGFIEEVENNKTFGDRKELADVLDKLMFVIYSVTAAALLAAHY